MPKTAPPAPPQLKAMRKVASPAVVPSTRPAVSSGLAAAAVGFLALNAAAAHPTLSSETLSLQSSLSDLQGRSSFSRSSAAISTLDTDLDRAGQLLESARSKGYRFQSDLEKVAYDAFSRWQVVRQQVLDAVDQQSRSFQNRLLAVDPNVQRLNGVLGNPNSAAPLLRSTQSQVNSILNDLSIAESNLDRSYSSLEEQVIGLNNRLRNIHWAIDQLAEAKFQLVNDEELVLAVANRWDQEGKDDPEGVLYLTDRRLIFERKEKVATKKILFITTASELVQEVLVDQPLNALAGIKAENKGLFGHQDFLQVEFLDRKLGSVAFHIDGQNSKDWVSLIERAKTGQITAERVNASSGLSVQDLTRPLTTADILAIQNEVNELQDEMMLKRARQELSVVENAIRSAERKLADLRARGYEIEKDLEADVVVLAAQWDRVKTNSEMTLEHQSGQLGTQMQSIHNMLADVVGMSANLATVRPRYMQLKSAIASAEAQADAAEATVIAQYDAYSDEVEALDAHLEWISWLLDALATASFNLRATESGVAATEAVFQHPNWEPENGILFLTDQRLLWEDRVDTYELKINAPIQEVLEVKKQVDGQTGIESLVFQFGPSGPVPQARFELALPVCDDWLKMVGRARTGGYTHDRAVEISSDELNRIRNAPQQCSNCGAAFTAPILRGQTEIQCEYCGVVTRI
jgi:predicted nuclease with TOPRIM domain